MTIFPYLLAPLAGVLFTEVVGYFLHILLHSEKIAWLSRDHMIHHLRIYSLEAGLRQPAPYKDSLAGRASVSGVGLEWILPIVGVIALLLVAFNALGLPWGLQAAVLVPALAWGKLMFAALHDSMHIEGHWLTRLPFVSSWFIEARRLHDVHHVRFSDDGRMLTNFGIAFFGFDRLFGTYRPKAESFNAPGYKACLTRYAAIIN